MQALDIIREQSISLESNQIFLIKKDFDFSALKLTDQEIAYVKSEFERKNLQVFVNRYTHWIGFQTFDAGAELYKAKESMRNAGCSACQHLQKQKINSITIVDKAGSAVLVKALVEGLALSNYQFIKYFKDADKKKSSLTQIRVISDCSNDELNNLKALVDGIFIARDLVNEPASYLTSVKLSEEIIQCCLSVHLPKSQDVLHSHQVLEFQNHEQKS